MMIPAHLVCLKSLPTLYKNVNVPMNLFLKQLHIPLTPSPELTIPCAPTAHSTSLLYNTSNIVL